MPAALHEEDDAVWQSGENSMPKGVVKNSEDLGRTINRVLSWLYDTGNKKQNSRTTRRLTEGARKRGVYKESSWTHSQAWASETLCTCAELYPLRNNQSKTRGTLKHTQATNRHIQKD